MPPPDDAKHPVLDILSTANHTAGMAQSPFNLSIQRIADAQGRLQPPERAVRFLSPFTSIDVPAETLRGASGSGEVTGYTAIGLDTSLLPGVISSRIVTGTAPIRVNGGNSADLGAGNITLTIEPATTLAPGSMSAADKARLDAILITDVTGTSPIVVTPVGTVRDVSILPANSLTPGSLSVAHYNLLTNILTATTPTTIEPDAIADPGILSTRAARADHTHAIVAATAGAIAIGDAAAEGVATSFARSDHVHSLAAPAAPTTIVPDAAASAGAATSPARADHTHAINAAAPGSLAIGDTAAEGAGNDFARATHRHDFPAPNPGETQSVGAANSNGTSPRVARADHVHLYKGSIRCGANSIAGTTTTRYMTDGFNFGTAPTTTLDVVVGRAFQVSELWTNARVGGTAGQTITATLRKNDSAVAAAFITHASDNTATASNTFTPVSFSPGDTWGLEITKSGAIASSPTDIWYVLVITPP